MLKQTHLREINLSGFWYMIPKGIWKVSDPQDAINALRDRESMPDYDPINFRIHVLGPSHKAVILDLRAIITAIGDDYDLYKTFVRVVMDVLHVTVN